MDRYTLMTAIKDLLEDYTETELLNLYYFLYFQNQEETVHKT